MSHLEGAAALWGMVGHVEQFCRGLADTLDQRIGPLLMGLEYLRHLLSEQFRRLTDLVFEVPGDGLAQCLEDTFITCLTISHQRFPHDAAQVFVCLIAELGSVLLQELVHPAPVTAQ